MEVDSMTWKSVFLPIFEWSHERYQF